MIRSKRNGMGKRLTAVLLSAVMLMGGSLGSVSAETVYAASTEKSAVSANETGDAMQVEEDTEASKETGEKPEDSTLKESRLETSQETAAVTASTEEENTENVEEPPEECDFTVEDTGEVLLPETAYLANTETKKVAVDNTSIAVTSVYKDMDYSFLKNYSFGGTSEKKATVTFGSAEELKKSQDIRLTAGRIIKTEGYYESGDGGKAVYEILSESAMKQADKKEGAILLTNGMYACIVPDIYEIEGKKWVLVNALQFGACGDGVTPSQAAISEAFSSVSKHVAGNEEAFRGIAYIPAGEYKCSNEIVASKLENINIVGDGSSTILFTDNDYRAEEGYSEFFFAVWESENLYFGDFSIEAREVDLYHYMRQFVLVYCNQVYIYNVDLTVPQEAYSGYYWEDKQYSNFTCYSGDTNITVDGCKMVQFSGTYRGANVGILDFWDREVKNITVMNCDLYSNARDEQIGIFNIPKTGTKVNENTSISNIDLINNTIHTTPVKYEEVIGNQNMCFTVAYGESVRIDDVRIAGNHFICEVDSKFMTFGTITNCVVEDNIIEIISTRNNGASVFDSSNADPANILIRNNEFFLTSTDGRSGKAGFTQGNMTFENNRVISDGVFPWYVVGQVAKGNEFVLLKPVAYLTRGVNTVENNVFYLYGGASSGNSNAVFELSAADSKTKATIKNNTVYDYKYRTGKRNVWEALVSVVCSTTVERPEFDAEFSGNIYYAPNRKFTTADHYSTEEAKTDVDYVTDSAGNKQITNYYNRMFYLRVPDDSSTCKLKNLIFRDNRLQGVKGYVDWNNGSRTVAYSIANNTTLPYDAGFHAEEPLVSGIDILYQNNKVTELAVTGNSVKLDKIVRVATKDADGNVLEERTVTDKEIKWYTSVNSMAEISEDGTVTRKLYGDVTVFAVATDGSAVYGECTIHFLKNRAASLSFADKTVNLQPGLKYYADYVVLPETEASQNLKWTSSDENVATVSKTGLVTAVSVGKAVITGTTTDGSNLSASIEVNVTPVTVKKMTMSDTWLHLTQEQIGESRQLSIKGYEPNNASNKTVKRWESTDTSVAVVDSQGKVTIAGSGRTEIRAYSTDEYCYACCVIYVQPDKVENFHADRVLKNKVILSWDAVEKSYGYYLYQWDAALQSWTALNNGRAIARDKTTYEVSGLNPGTEYKFCVRAYYWNNSDLEHCPYESKDSTITVNTYNYSPVTSIKGEKDVFTIVDYSWKNRQDTFTVRYNTDADYTNLSFDCKIADESIAKVVSVEKGNNAGELKIKLEGRKYGMTKLIITANDGGHASTEIPVGFLTDEKVTNCKADAVYKRVTITFDGLEDETDIDGYYVQIMVTGYTYKELVYIPKTGAATYSAVDKNVDIGAGLHQGGYRYIVTPCLTDGAVYCTGSIAYTNDNQSVQIPEPTKAVTLEIKQPEYVVKGGETVEVSAVVGNDETTWSELYWEIIRDDYATVERIEKEAGENLTDYARITGVDAGVTKIKAVTTDGSDLEAFARLIVVPQPVTNLKAQSEGTSVFLSWTKIKNADGYIIYRCDENKQEFSKLAEVSECQFQDTGLEENMAYRYKIVAYMYVDGTRYEGNSTPEIGVATADSHYGIYATGYSGVYDGTGHAAVTVTGIKKNTDTVTYSVDRKNWLDTVPTVKDVRDSKTIYVRVVREGQKNPYEIAVAANVLPCSLDVTDIALELSMQEWDGKAHMPELVSRSCALNTDYTVSGLKEYKNIGSYPITVTGIGNYTGTKQLTYEIAALKGHKYTISGYIYKVTGKNTVSVVGIKNKKAATIKVKNTVKIGGKKYKITGIGAKAFKNCKKAKKAVIGSYVTTIGSNAFCNCTKLKNVTMGKRVKTIGSKAFYKCKKLSKITIPSKVTKIGKQAFYGCEGLKTITIKTKKLKSSKVGSKAFTGTPENVKVNMPKSKVKAYTSMLKKKGIKGNP